MKSIAALLIAPVVLAAAPAPQQARTETPSRAAMERVSVSRLAGCTLDRSGKRAAEILAMEEGPDSRTAMTQLASNNCLSRDIEFGEKDFRGALFVELYKRRAAGKTVPSFAPFDPDQTIDGDAERQRFTRMLWFADCVVKRDAAAAKDVVSSAIGSAQQAAAYKRLQPNLGPCLVEGSQVRFTKASLEGALAEILYRASA